MVMLDHCGPTREEIRGAFNKAAEEGNKYLLMLSENTNDEVLITIYDYTRPVADQSAIVPLLRELNERCCAGDIRLTGVLDLSKNFETQIARPYAEGLKETLSPQVQSDLVTYGRAVQLQHAQNQLQHAQKEWDCKPWLARLFSNRP